MTVEIWSDIVCPWCYIGKRRFETALGRFAHRDDVQVIWRSFQLDPTAPREGREPMNEVLARKYNVSAEEARTMTARVTSVAAGEGLEYRLENTRHTNTMDGHRLIHLAAKHGLQAAAKERLLSAYFTESRDIGSRDVLLAIAAEVGLPDDEVRRALESDEYADEVRADIARGEEFGIRGVPFFVIDERYGVSGAQSADVLLQSLERAWEESRPAEVKGTGDGEMCDDGQCAA